MYSELHCLSNFSFLRGASHPRELVARAAELDLTALAITDRNGFYGAVQAWEAQREIVGAPPLIHGSELTLSMGAEQAADALVLLARDAAGYARICGLICEGKRHAEKGSFALQRDEVLACGGEGLIVLCGGRESRLLRLLRSGEESASRAELGGLREAFGDALYFEITRHLRPGDARRSRALAALGARLGVPVVATNDVLFHRRERKPLHDLLTCIRERVPLERAGRRLLPNAERVLKSPEAMRALFVDMPEAIARSVEIAERCRFKLGDLRYAYPEEAVPPGETQISFLSRLAREGLRACLGPQRARELGPQLARELRVIEELGYAGYFLTMWRVVQYCSEQRILYQGRGSAANSLVCYATGITSVSPDQIDMLFERFLSAERGEPPDIDLDIEHDRREEVIQHVYEAYGRERAAMVAEVIRYQPRSAIRDAGKALGLSSQAVLRVSRFIAHTWDAEGLQQAAVVAGISPRSATWRRLIALAADLVGFPRHLSIHVGGFLLSSAPLSRIVPIEPARMPGRTVIQWDKDDLDALRIFKVDLLGLGMLNVIARAFALIAAHRGTTLELGRIPPDDRPTYEMIQRADTVGVFQIESRAQMSMLPRLRPRCFYDLVIEVALIRPGPIQGGMVHPYLRRRRGEEPVEFPHPKLHAILSRTLGVPIFQEQVMRMAVEVGGYTPGEADQLRRDMAAWRRQSEMAQHQQRLYARMRANGIDEEFAKRVVRQIEGFGAYGFPESHAAAFAHLAYVSAYLKRHFPAEFAAALINAQPMGFYSVATLVGDAHRHGVRILPVDVQHSAVEAQVKAAAPLGALRLGLRSVRGLGEAAAAQIVAEREARGAFSSPSDLAERCQLDRKQLMQLALAGALRSLAERRQAIWQSAALGTRSFAGGRDLVANLLAEPPAELAPLPLEEELRLDAHHAGSFLERHPLQLWRAALSARGVRCAAELVELCRGSSVSVAGLVLVRQRPTGPGGAVFLALEDETGLVDVTLRPALFERCRALVSLSELLLVHGRLQADEGARSVLATRVERLAHEEWGTRVRDFH